MSRSHWLKSREIVERIIIQGDLILETPVGFGSGDNELLVDMPLLLDPLENRALLTGASLAGALRSYLREREHGYGEKGDKDSLFSILFGYQKNDEGEQSLLIVNDSLSDKPNVELRDGVKIDNSTRTAQETAKFDFELISTGTCFHIRMELLLREDRKKELLRGLVIALQGLERCEINLGVRKRRGFGKCRVKKWNVSRYDLTKPDGLIGWLKNYENGESRSNIADLIDADKTDMDNRNIFSVDATFALKGSLLIKSNFDDVNAPDSVHLKSNRNGQLVPILSGTSLAGALRARSLQIANTISKNGNGKDIVDRLFGPDINSKSSRKETSASQLITEETEIINPLEIVQSRVKIDRFTGSSFPTALFNEQPLFGQENNTHIRTKIHIRQPDNAQIGLLLLLLKDLWTRDLSLGGETSVGRGRLQGITTTITHKLSDSKPEEWIIDQAKNQLDIKGNMEKLESFVSEFQKVMQE